jgi:hypothetical protein
LSQQFLIDSILLTTEGPGLGHKWKLRAAARPLHPFGRRPWSFSVKSRWGWWGGHVPIFLLVQNIYRSSKLLFFIVSNFWDNKIERYITVKCSNQHNSAAIEAVAWVLAQDRWSVREYSYNKLANTDKGTSYICSEMVNKSKVYLGLIVYPSPLSGTEITPRAKTILLQLDILPVHHFFHSKFFHFFSTFYFRSLKDPKQICLAGEFVTQVGRPPTAEK